MKNRLPAARAATPATSTVCALLTIGALSAICGFAPASAEEALQPLGRLDSFGFCAAGSGCVRFQGYIYVNRKPGKAPAEADRTPSSPSLAGERLYIHAGDAETR
jgi:hypothetical protein